MENENFEYDLIVIGAGPAGLSAAQYGARANLSVLVIDETMPGGQVNNIFELENYPGVYPAVSGPQFVMSMKNQAEAFGAKIIQKIVSGVEKKNGKFYVTAGGKEYVSLTLVAASGAEHRKLGCEGEAKFSGRGVSYCATCDGPFFRNKKIFVVGGGDSACSEAEYLATLTDSVTIIHRKSQFRAQKAVADRVLNNPKISVMFNTVVSEVKGEMKVSSLELTDVVTGEKKEVEANALFIFVGMLPRTELFEELEKDGDGYFITDENMHTKIDGLYVAGDLRAKSFRQIVTACSDGAIAAHEAQIYISECRNEVYK